MINKIYIGSSEECNNVVIKDLGVSGRHCTIEKIDTGYKLIDLDSANGTYINEIGYRSIEFTEPGTIIRLGKKGRPYSVEKLFKRINKEADDYIKEFKGVIIYSWKMSVYQFLLMFGLSMIFSFGLINSALISQVNNMYLVISAFIISLGLYYLANQFFLQKLKQRIVSRIFKQYKKRIVCPKCEIDLSKMNPIDLQKIDNCTSCNAKYK